MGGGPPRDGERERASTASRHTAGLPADPVTRGFAHDLANLITVIAGNAEELGRLGGLDASAVAAVGGIRAAADSATALVRRLQLAAAGRSVEPTAIALNEVVERSEPLVRAVAGHDVELALEIDPGAGRVLGDELELQRVLLNLVANAREAITGAGRLTIATADDPPGHVRLVVADTGRGMPQIDSDVAGASVGDGRELHGLGLCEVRRIVEHHGGTVAITSAPERGTVVTVRLPVAESARLPVGAGGGA